jgi:hypothetical protein
MNKKTFAVLLSVMVLLATVCTQVYAKTPQVTISKAYTRCLEVQKTNKTLKAYKNGEVALTEGQIAAIKEKYLGYLEEAFAEINKPANAFYINYLLKTTGLLPENVSQTVKNIVAVAKLDISTDEKLEILADSSTCSDLVDVAVSYLIWGLYFLFSVAVVGVIGLAPNIVLISVILANLSFVISLIAVILYPIFCLF